MLVKVILSAAGADFTVEYGQEFEFADLKALIGNGAENFCVPVDETVVWPVVPEAPVEVAVVPATDVPEVVAAVETAVVPDAPETATKRGKSK